MFLKGHLTFLLVYQGVFKLELLLVEHETEISKCSFCIGTSYREKKLSFSFLSKHNCYTALPKLSNITATGFPLPRISFHVPTNHHFPNK